MNINIYLVNPDGSGTLVEQLQMGADTDAITYISNKSTDGNSYRAEEQKDNTSRIIGQVP